MTHKFNSFLRKYTKFEGVKTHRMANPDFTVRATSRIYIASATELLPSLVGDRRVVVVTDATIDRLYADLLKPYEKILIGRGETIKTLQTAEQIVRQLVAMGADRNTFLLAVGGGIVTDIAGFVASIYMRGIRFGFISTTLLGQVDASVGGKNGVNLDGYKNMIGCFTQPEFVICDPTMLLTLPEREFRAGLAEIVKASIIGDEAMFCRLEQATVEELRRDRKLLAAAVRSAVRVKAEIVERDEREAGDRRLLNLGHTLAHAIEKSSKAMIHGEAVAVGTAVVADVAVKIGLLTSVQRDRIRALLVRFGLTIAPPVAMSRLLKVMTKDKKSAGNDLHLILPREIGRCEVMTVNKQDLNAWFE